MILYNSSYENDSVVPALGDSDNELILEVVSDFRCCTRGAVDLERDDSDIEDLNEEGMTTPAL